MAEKIITTEELLGQSKQKSFSTEELFGRSLPANNDPTLPQYIKYKLTIDKANAVRSTYGREAMWGRMDTTEALSKGNKERDYWLKKAGPYEDLAFREAPFKYVVGEAAQLLPYMLSSQKEGLKYALTIGGGFAAITAAAGQAGPQALVPEEFITVPAAFGIGMKTGYSYGVINNILDREGGDLYLDMVEKGVSEDTARPLSLASGTLIGVIELAQFKLLSKPFKQAFSKVIRTDTGKKAISLALGRYLRTVGGEVAEEELQEVTSLVAETIGGMIDEKPDATPTPEEWRTRLIETAARSAAGLSVIAGPGGVVDVAATARAKKLVKTQEDVDLINEIVEAVREAPTEPAVEAIAPEVEEGIPEAEKAPIIAPEVAKEAIKPEVIEPDTIGRTALDKEIEAMETRLEKVERASEALQEGRKIKDLLKGRIKPHEKGFLAEELKNFPKGYVTKKGAIFPDEALEEVNQAGLGITFKNLRELSDYLRDWEAQEKSLKDIIKTGKPKIISKKETTILKEKIQHIRRGIREGRRIAKEEIKDLQGDIVRLIDSSELAPADKAKFIKTIKNIQTQEQLQKAMPDIVTRMARLEVAAEKTKLGAKIKKELKAAKPRKVGQKRIGKYDYETNKLFEDLREFSRFNKAKAQAELDTYPETGTEIELIRKRFLSLKANGKAASSELFRQVFKDIQTMKKIGEQAKTEEDFIKGLERQERANEALQAIGRIKGNKKTIKTKIGNVYRKGFSNIYSMLNSTFGKTMAEKYDPEIAENNRDTAIYFKTKQIANEASRIYVEKNVMSIFETMAKAKYKLVDFDGLVTEVSKLELIDIYNSLKNDNVKQRYYDTFGEAQVQNLMGELNGNDIALADYLQETVQEYRSILNQRSIEITGRDLGFVENYWPATSEYKENVFDDIRIQGETPSAMKERAKGKVIPKPSDAWYKTQRHIAQAEHVSNLSRPHETLKRLFTDRKVKHSIEDKFGEDVYKVLRNQIDNLSLNAHITKIDAVSGWFRTAINNWVTAKIALNPSTLVRQLMSTGNYIEDMSAAEWTGDFLKGITSPKETFNFMWNNAPFLEARFNRGYTEAIKDAISGAEKISAHWGSWHKFLSTFARAGDITAIIYGGYPLVQSELKKGKSIKEAMVTFEKATIKAQQSGLSSSLSQFQNSRNPFARLFLAFKNTANQYFRKMGDAIMSYHNGDISLGQFSKVMAIYAVIQPILYSMSGLLVKEAVKKIGGRGEDELVEKILDEIMIQLVVNPVNAIPVISDIVRFTMRKISGQQAWKIFSTPFLDDLETGLSKLTKKDVTAGDYLKASASVLEPITAAPINTFIRFYEYIAGKEGKKKGLSPI